MIECNYSVCVLLCSEQNIQMEDDSSVLKYIDIVPFDNSAQQFEDVKPFQVRVFIVTSGTGTNLKVGGGLRFGVKRQKNILVVPLQFLALKVQLVVF